MKRIFPVLIAVVIILLFCINSAFGQCGLPGTPRCPEKPRPVPTPVKPKPKQPKKPIVTVKPKSETERRGKKPPSVVERPRPMEFVKILAGEFQMGSNNGDADEKPVHRVRISKDFEMGKTEVTQAQWKSVMGDPLKTTFIKLSDAFCYIAASESRGDNKPMYCVSWEDVQKFVSQMNLKNDGYKYRLPTEAEWEYAARAGDERSQPNDKINSMAWHKSNSGGKFHNVATKQPNPWNLYDIQGNVFEWCEDWFDEAYYKNSPSIDPTGPSTGKQKVGRGGSWNMDAVRLSARGIALPNERYYFVGFRLVREHQSR